MDDKLRKLGRLTDAYIAGKLLPLSESMGGNAFHEGRLFILPQMGRDEISRLSISRTSRLMRDEDDYVVGLKELDKVSKGHFYDVQEDEKKVPFVRDDLLEPTDSSVSLLLYKNDIVLKSQGFRDKTALLACNLGGSSYVSVDDRFVDNDDSSKSFDGEGEMKGGVREEKGARKGSRAAITQLTRKSSDKMKFTLRNSLCDFEGFITLTYPRRFPRNGKACKKHLNLFLTHLRKDYKGIKYFWFMEFQKRGAPHFHLFLSCVIPGKTYVSPLWYRIVGSNDPAHLRSGTNVIRMRSSKDVAKYATSYAKKLTQKMTPKDFASVGRFWGCSNKLCSTIMELSDVSVRQIQELWSRYYEDIGLGHLGLRVDRFNGYIWNGHRYAGMLALNYYEAHLRPLVSEVSMVCGKSGSVGIGLNGSAKEADSLWDSKVLRKTVLAGSSVWKTLTEAQFDAELKKGTVRLKYLNNRYEHSLLSAYAGIDKESYEDSFISLEDWGFWLSFLQVRMELNWATQFQPLVRVWYHTHVALCKDGRIYKRKYVASFQGTEKASYKRFGRYRKLLSV